MTIACIGIGNVGFALANNLQKKGHTVIVASDNPNSESVQSALQRNPEFSLNTIQNAVDRSDLTFLATPFFANEEVLANVDFKGKILVDCTNPVGPVISHGLNNEISGSGKVQEWASTAKVIKAFTIYGFENFINPSFPNYDVTPVMLIAGNDQASKTQFEPLVNDLGYMMKDVGGLDQALHLEHMTLLWVKMVRKNGHHPHFVWAYLER
ncbi:MAG: NAD(P)-binding domain-containing protein [Bacteroidota bacterium]